MISILKRIKSMTNRKTYVKKEVYQMSRGETKKYLKSLGMSNEQIREYDDALDILESYNKKEVEIKELSYDNNKAFVDNFRKFQWVIRLRNNHVMKNMADSMGVSVSFLSSIEHGRKPVPNNWFDKLERVYILDSESEKMLKILKEKFHLNNE